MLIEGTKELIAAIEELQEDQKNQIYLLENYLGTKNFKEAAAQQSYIDGMGRAIFLLMAKVSARGKAQTWEH